MDQGAYWIEQLRWTRETLAARRSDGSKGALDTECGEHFSEEGKEREREWMRKNNCTDPEKRARSRRCTFTVPYAMSCWTYNFARCYKRATNHWGIVSEPATGVVHQRPPILYWPRDVLMPFVSKPHGKVVCVVSICRVSNEMSQI